MLIPHWVRECMDALEQAGHCCYCVGGCVRDSLLGNTPQDYDLCTSATPEQIQAVFSRNRLILAGQKHGTVGVITPEGVVEITTFRTEGAYQDNRHPDWVAFVSTIEQDLARRDFTVNAMAYSPTRGLVDPFGGARDLQNRILRTVGDPRIRFREDALRIVRGVRFSARFDLSVQQDTLQAMLQLAPLMEQLARERVFDELCKLLPHVNAKQLTLFHPVICQLLPELSACVGFDQHTPYHAFDVFTHTAHVVAAAPPQLPVRWAALLHDAGKPQCFCLDNDGRGHFKGHARHSAAIAEQALTRLKAPNALRQRVVFLVAHHMDPLIPDPNVLRRQLSRYGTEAMLQLIDLHAADLQGTGVPADTAHLLQVRQLIGEILTQNACLSLRDLAVNGHDLMALGFSGPDIGKALNALLDAVLDERLPNEKEALLCAAKEM